MPLKGKDIYFTYNSEFRVGCYTYINVASIDEISTAFNVPTDWVENNAVVIIYIINGIINVIYHHLLDKTDIEKIGYIHYLVAVRV